MIKVTEEFLFSHTADEVAIYSVVNYLFHKMGRKSIYINYDMISYYMYGSKPTRKLREMIKTNFDGLVDEGVFNLNGVALTIPENSYDKSGFIMIPYEYFRRIAEIPITGREMYTYLLKVLTTRNYKTGIGNQKIEYLAKLADISVDTAIKYNHRLEKLSVLYIRRSFKASKTDGVYTRGANAYGLIDDYEAVDKFAGQHYYNKNKSKHDPNWQRSVSARYNAFVSNPASFTKGEIRNLHKQCEEYNAIMEQMQEAQHGNYYLAKKKDLAVFNLTNL